MLLLFLNILTTLAKDKPLWVEFLGLFITVGLAAWGFIRAYRAWERQKKREIDLHFEQQRYEQRLAACRGIYPLLAYLSKWENDKTVFVKQNSDWFFRKKQGEEYILALTETFFDKGYGVFMPKEVRDGLYNFRGIVYKLLDANTRNPVTEDIVKVKNPGIPEVKIPDLFNKINSSLREMLLDSKITFKG